MKITDYDIACDSDPCKMARQVQEDIEKGWQPFGSPMVMDIGRDKTTWHYQAVVKYEKETDQIEAANPNVLKCPGGECYFCDTQECLDCSRGQTDHFKQK